MKNCIFCRILTGEAPSKKIFENAEFLALLDINPINPGHTLLIPKKHVSYVFDMGEKIYSELFRTAKILADPLKEATNAKRIGIAVEGFAVPHVHLHIVPLNSENELDPKRATPASQEELSEMQKKIKKKFKF